MNSALIEKIKKLLALAQSDIPAERDAAIAKAHALALENKIDLALLDLSDVGRIAEEKFVKGEIIRKNRNRTVVERFIAWIIREHFDVKIVWGGIEIWFVGRHSDVEFAKWLHSYLTEEFARRWDYYRRGELEIILADSDGDARTYRNSFFYGVYQGLDARLTEEKKETERRGISVRAAGSCAHPADVGEKAGELTHRYQLAVVDETKKREAALKEFFPRLSHGRGAKLTACHRSGSAQEAGRAHGRSISTNRPLNA